MKVSVIIPVYNVQEYLAECLDSIINQTEKDIEIICVEDCSTDSSLKILQEYAKKDDRIVILQNEKNSGLSVTRNNGLNIAKGEYVLFVDSDDFIEPTLLETTLKFASDVDMVCFDYREYDGKRYITDSHIYGIPDGYYKAYDYYLDLFKGNMFIFSACSKLFRRSFLNEHNIRFEKGVLYEDVLFGFYCMINAQSIYSLKEKMYFYRTRPNSITRTRLKEKNIKDHFYSLYKICEYYLSNSFSKEHNILIEKFIQRLERDYIRLYREYFCQNKDKGELIEEECTNHVKLQRAFSNSMLGITDYTLLLEKHLNSIKRSEKIIIYGAGIVAREVINCFDLNDVSITGVAVSDVSKNRKSLFGNPVRALSEYENIKEECLVIIAVSSKFSSEIEDYLKKQGFKNYIKLF